MKRIVSQEEIERKQKRNSRLIAGMLLLILAGSVAGFATFYGGSDSSDNSNSDNVEDTLQNILPFGTPVDEVKNISTNFLIRINEYYGQEVYIASDDLGVASGLSSVLKNYALRVQTACYGKCDKDLPEKSCSDNLIVYKESSEKSVYQNEKCIFIDGDLTSADAFIYRLFGGS